MPSRKMVRRRTAALTGAVFFLVLLAGCCSCRRQPRPALDVTGNDNKAPWHLQNPVKALALARMPGPSHGIMLDEPESFARLVDGFVSGLS